MWKPLPKSMYEYGPILTGSLGSGIDLGDVERCKEKMKTIRDVIGKHLSELFLTFPYGGGYIAYLGNLDLGQLICYCIKDGWSADLERLYKKLSPPWQPDPVAKAEVPMFKAYTPIGTGMYLDVLVRPRLGMIEVQPEGLKQAKNELSRAELDYAKAETHLTALERRMSSEVVKLANRAVETMMNRPKRRWLLIGPDPVKMRIYNEVKGIAYENPAVSSLRPSSGIFRQHLGYVFQTNADRVSKILGGEFSKLKEDVEVAKNKFMGAKARFREQETIVRELETRTGGLDGGKQKVNLLKINVEAAVNPEYEFRLVDSSGRTRQSSHARTLPQAPPGFTIKHSRKLLTLNNLSEQDMTTVFKNLDLLTEQLSSN